MSEGQLRLFLKDKDPTILIEDDAEIDVEASRLTFAEETIDKPSEESQSSSSEEQNFDALHMQRSWSVLAQPAHSVPVQKKPKKPKKAKPKPDSAVDDALDNALWEECLEITPPIDFQRPDLRRKSKLKLNR
eukprot:1000057-Amphidinium_carterae.1